MKKWLRRVLPKFGLALKSDQDWAYEQRDIAALLASAFASQAGYQVSRYRDDQVNWDEDWRTVLQISGLGENKDLQVSWHLGPNSRLIAHRIYPEKKITPWDGTCYSKDLEFIERII
jgi:hypothetical protein